MVGRLTTRRPEPSGTADGWCGSLRGPRQAPSRERWYAEATVTRRGTAEWRLELLAHQQKGTPTMTAGRIARGDGALSAGAPACDLASPRWMGSVFSSWERKVLGGEFRTK